MIKLRMDISTLKFKYACGLHQSGALSNNQLKYRMKKENYYEVSHTPGLCKTISVTPRSPW